MRRRVGLLGVTVLGIACVAGGGDADGGASSSGPDGSASTAASGSAPSTASTASADGDDPGSDGTSAGLTTTEDTQDAGEDGDTGVGPGADLPGEPIACATGRSVADSPVAQLAASMSSGEWAALSTEGLDEDLLYIDALGDFGSTAHTDWSDELSWDPCTQQLLYIGAGHLRPYGFVRFDAPNNTWFRTDDGLPDCMYVGGYEGCFTHGYDNAALDVDAGRLWFNAQSRLFSFDVATQSWEEHASWPAELPVGYGSATELFVSTNELVSVLGGSVGVFDMTTGTGTRVVDGLAMGPYHNSAVYSPLHDLLLFGGGNDSSAFFAMDAAHQITPLPDTPRPLHIAYTTLTFDPTGGDVLLLGSDGSMHAFDPSSGVWSPAPPPPFELSGEQHALAAPLHDHGVVLFMRPQGAYDVHLYKH